MRSVTAKVGLWSEANFNAVLGAKLNQHHLSRNRREISAFLRSGFSVSRLDRSVFSCARSLSLSKSGRRYGTTGGLAGRVSRLEAPRAARAQRSPDATMLVGVPRKIKVHEYRGGLASASVGELGRRGQSKLVDPNRRRRHSWTPGGPARPRAVIVARKS